MHTRALFFECTRLLHSHQPATFLLENVPNIAEVDGGKAHALVVEELEAAGPVTRRSLFGRLSALTMTISILL
jgi:site-specific DNA-cytosine methylase